MNRYAKANYPIGYPQNLGMKTEIFEAYRVLRVCIRAREEPE